MFPAYPPLYGHTDWGPAGQNNFTYQFQCTPYGGPQGDGASLSPWFLDLTFLQTAASYNRRGRANKGLRLAEHVPQIQKPLELASKN